MRKFKALMVLAAGIVPLSLALIVLLGNLGDEWVVHIIYRDYPAKRSTILVLAALVGWVVCKLAIIFIPRGIQALKDCPRQVERDSEKGESRREIE